MQEKEKIPNIFFVNFMLFCVKPWQKKKDQKLVWMLQKCISSLKIAAFYVMVERNNSASSLLKTKRLMKRQLVQGGNFDMNFLEHPSSKCFGPPCFVRALPKKLRRWLKSIAKTPCWKGKNVQSFQRISMKYWKVKLIKKCT